MLICTDPPSAKCIQGICKPSISICSSIDCNGLRRLSTPAQSARAALMMRPSQNHVHHLFEVVILGVLWRSVRKNSTHLGCHISPSTSQDLRAASFNEIQHMSTTGLVSCPQEHKQLANYALHANNTLQPAAAGLVLRALANACK